MSLTKFVSIKNVGRFQNYTAAGDITLKRVNLIFAENGRGKSTLCAILRSVQSNDPAYVLGRATLGGTAIPTVQILTSSGTVSFKASAWTEPLPHLAIFDSTFIAENVYSGDAIDLEHRRNLYRVIIGKQGVKLAQEVNDIDGEIRSATSAIKIKRASVEGRMPAGMSFEVFTALAADPLIDEKIATKEKELEAVQQGSQLRARAGLSEITLPVPPDNFESLLGRTIFDLSADAERRVAEHLATHEMQETGERWVQEGLGYIRADACPFCNQSLVGVELIGAYRAFFGEAYNELKDAISYYRTQLNILFGDRAIADAEKPIASNDAAAEFWNRYCSVAPRQLSSPQGFGASLREMRDAAIVLLERKAAAPLEAVLVDHRYLNALDVIKALRASATEYNAAVTATNVVINAQKVSLEDASAEQIQRDLQKLKAAKARHSAEGSKACADHVEEANKKETLEGKKTTARDKLDAHTKTVIKTYEKTINKLLVDFQAGFRITGTKHAYPGGVPSSDFQILINDTPVSLGDGKTPLSTPSFRNTLSSGDKSTLALAFFLAELEHDPNKANRIVVFDDPFNSQDAFRKDHTVQKIRKCGEECLQVIVLSHDQSFLKRLYDRLRAQNLEHKCLHLSRIGHSNTIMSLWDIDEATQLQYRADLRALTNFYNGVDAGKPRETIDKIRPVLETFCRNLYPTHFEDDDTLGVICGKVRTAGSGHGLAHVCDDLDAANDYTRRYHHGESPATAASEPINDTELQGFVGTALMIVGTL
jgi:wobble nucleotide-excising tRNase